MNQTSLFPNIDPGKSLFEKWCTKCGSRKSLDKFPTQKDKKSTKGSICKQCLSKWNIQNNKKPHRRFDRAVSKAKSKGLEWTLSREQYAALVAKKCEYCGHDLPLNGVGLDRLDCSLGYILENVVPACEPCNMARNAIFTPEEMRLFLGPAIHKVYEHRLKKGESVVLWRDKKKREH